MSDDDVWSLTPEQATARLAEMMRPAPGVSTPPPPPPKDAAEARSRLDALSSDPAWQGKLLASDTDTVKEFNALTQLIAGPDPTRADLAIANLVPAGETTLNGETSIRVMAAAAAGLRA